MELRDTDPATPAHSRSMGFLSLAPDTRNSIYELVYQHHKRSSRTVTVSSEKGYQEVPAAISRTCHQVRSETLPYFFELDHIIFVIRGSSDLEACREWLGLVPEPAWAMVRGIRFRQTHWSSQQDLQCNLNFDLDLRRIEAPVSYWGQRQPWCGICASTQGQMDCVPMVDMIMKNMCGGGGITSSGVDLILDLLEPLTTD